MATGDFDAAYSEEPWSRVGTKERVWYEPVLIDLFRRRSIFRDFTNYRINLGNVDAKTMTVTSALDPHPNFNALGLRDIWMDTIYSDSRSVEITFDHFGSKIAYHKYDQMVSYWKKNAGTAAGVRAIANDKLGLSMVYILDLLSRNALLSLPNAAYAGGATDFNTLTPAKKMSTGLVDEIHTDMRYRSVPYAISADGKLGTIVAITSPGVIHDLQQQSDPKDWLIPQAYANPQILLKNEVGTFKNVRWVQNPASTLMNCGEIEYQTTVSAAISAGDGAPNPSTTKVDGTYRTGQAAATHYIQLVAGTDMTKFEAGDWVTLHVSRTSDFGVTNGVDYRDGKAMNMRIAAGGVDAGNRRLTFTLPVMDDFKTDLGAGVYAYVTKGTHVHSTVFLGGPDSVVVGVGQEPAFYSNEPIDDFKAMWRFSWDTFSGYQSFRPESAQVVFSGGFFKNITGRQG